MDEREKMIEQVRVFTVLEPVLGNIFSEILNTLNYIETHLLGGINLMVNFNLRRGLNLTHPIFR